MSWYGVTDSGWFFNHRYEIAVAGWPARLTSWGELPYDPKDERFSQHGWRLLPECWVEACQ